MSDGDNYDVLCDKVKEAAATGMPLNIIGGDSKAFYGRAAQGEPLMVAGNRGIVAYDPTELVITARGGTTLNELEGVLAQRGQMLGFEPPHFGEGATLGGAVACGLSGPRRPYAGSARDFVLGTRVLNGKGEVLKFGGQVMKNVAGYDVSRLMTGALGTLGVILEVSLRVLPRPAVEQTLMQPLAPMQAIETINRWAGQPHPLSAAAYDGEVLYVRLSGSASGVRAAKRAIGGDALEQGGPFWDSLREQRHPFFARDTPLWRLSLPAAAPIPEFPGDWLLDWGGAQRWLHSEAPAEQIRSAAAAAGGHVVLFRGGDREGQVFQPLSSVLQRLHQNLKKSFDPGGIFNPGRMYAEF